MSAQISAVNSSLCGDFQVIEVRYGISLCPKADFARVLESFIIGFDFLGAIKVTNEFVSCCFNAKLVPRSRRNFEVGAGDLNAAAVDHVVESVVVLQSVSPYDVIIVRILQTENHAPCLINASGYRLELHADIQVAK